jgi:hypothetical protein
MQEAIYNVSVDARNDAMNLTDWVTYVTTFEIVGKARGKLRKRRPM